MPSHNFLSGNMAKPHEGSWIKSKSEKEADMAARAAYNAGRMADNALQNYKTTSETELNRLFTEATRDTDKEKYGKALLLKRYGEEWGPIIDKAFPSIYGVTAKENPAVTFIENNKSLKSKLSDADKALIGNWIDQNSDSFSENPEATAVSANFTNFPSWEDNQKRSYLKIVDFLHDPKKMRAYRSTPLDDTEIGSIEAEGDFDTLLNNFTRLQDKEPGRVSREDSKKSSTKKIKLSDLAIEDIDWDSIPEDKREKIKTLLTELKPDGAYSYK